MTPQLPAATLGDYYPLLRRQLDPDTRSRIDRQWCTDLPALVGEVLAALYHPQEGPN